MKKVFLVNPLVQGDKKERVRFLRDYAGGEIPTSMAYPPLDAAYTAALLRKNGIPVALLDASTLGIPDEEVARMASREKADFIGIPSAWGSINPDISLAQKLKRELPSAKIVIWGPNVTADPAAVLSSGRIDYAILGEPEKPFLDIANGMLSENIAYRIDGKITVGKRNLLQDLDSLPFPARDLLPNKKYIAPYAKNNPFTTMTTSRGCPYSKCSFCPTNIWYMGRVRYRSVENVLQEIDEIVNKFHIYSVIFRDQSLTFERERLLKICSEIIRRGYRLSWRCFSGVDFRNKELLSLMKKAGCYQINYGFESGSQKILDLNSKGITLEDSREAARLTKEAGIEVSGSFMLGMYGDTAETVKETMRFPIELDLDYAEFIIAVPLPSTKFYEQCGLDNKTTTSLSQRWFNRSYDSDTLLGGDFLNTQLRKAYRDFYFRPGYIFQKLIRISSWKQLTAQLKPVMALLSRCGS